MTTYERAGIPDVGAFYADKFFGSVPADILRRAPLARFDAKLARMCWVLAHVRQNARVLDFGCGSGTLGLLGEKGCEVYGLELSATAAARARTAGYREVFVGDLQAAPFAPGWFDHVVSLDVFGHVELRHKDAVITQLKRLLAPDGVMLHGIECGAVDYATMSAAELKSYVGVDGHVGVESEDAIVARWRRQFRHVDAVATFRIACDHETMLKVHRDYGETLPPDLELYLATLGAEEAQAFDVAMGIVAERILRSPLAAHEHGGFVLLRASDAPLPEPPPLPAGPAPQRLAPGDALSLRDAAFLRGWHEPEPHAEGWMRWSNSDALLRLRLAPAVGALRCTLRAPIGTLPRDVWFFLGRATQPTCTARLTSREPLQVTVPLGSGGGQNAERELGLRIIASGFGVPAFEGGSTDGRRLALCWSSIEAV